MTSLIDTLARINRPRLLIRAARFGLKDYNRNRDLKRILRGDAVPGPSRALSRLMDLEAVQEDTRRRGDAGYSVSTHLELLIAIMAEARLISGGTSQA